MLDVRWLVDSLQGTPSSSSTQPQVQRQVQVQPLRRPGEYEVDGTAADCPPGRRMPEKARLEPRDEWVRRVVFYHAAAITLVLTEC